MKCPVKDCEYVQASQYWLYSHLVYEHRMNNEEAHDLSCKVAWSEMKSKEKPKKYIAQRIALILRSIDEKDMTKAERQIWNIVKPM